MKNNAGVGNKDFYLYNFVVMDIFLLFVFY